MPPSWTTIRLVPDRVFLRAGTEVTPPGKTRFVLDGDHRSGAAAHHAADGCWPCFPVLP